MNRSLVIAVLFLAAHAPLAARAQLMMPGMEPKLKEGDAAPPFTVTQWLKGEPQDLAAGKGKKIFVLDFWATWCLPCLQEIPHTTAMQKKYGKDGVVFIGVTGPGLDNRQQLSQVKRFVKEQGDKMDYAIAWDQSNKMDIDYLMATGAPGIPHTVVIDKEGRVAWQGDPRMGLEEALDEMVAGTYDIAKEIARKENDRKLGQLLMRFQMAMQAQDHKLALTVLEESLQVDPTYEAVLLGVYGLHANAMDDMAAYSRWVESFIDKHQGDSEPLIALVNTLLSIEPAGHRQPALMVRAARKAFEAGGDKNVEAAAVYARAAHRVGNVEQAVILQTVAMERAPESRRAEIKTVLAYYETCRQLRDSGF